MGLFRPTLILTVLLGVFGQARATEVKIASQKFSDYNYAGSTALLRISYSRSFVDSDGKRVPAAYSVVHCGVDARTHELLIPSFTLITTEDSSDPAEVRATAIVSDESGVQRYALFSRWAIPAAFGSAVNMSQLRLYNLEKNALAAPPLAHGVTSNNVKSNSLNETPLPAGPFPETPKVKAPKSRGFGSAPISIGIDPASLAPDLYLTAGSLNLSDSAEIESWKDSGTNRNDAKSTGSNNPTYHGQAINRKPSVEFDGMSNRFTLSREVTDARTIILVLKHRTGTEIGMGHTSAILSDVAANTQDFAPSGGIGCPEWPSSFFYYTIAPFTPPTSLNVLQGRITINGFQVNSTPDPSVSYLEKPTQYSVIAIRTTDKVSFDTIGTNLNFPGTYFDGFLTDLVEWPTPLSDEQIDRMTAFLKQRYGIQKTQPQVLFVGDSITAGGGDFHAFENYPNKVMQQLYAEGLPSDWWNFATGSQQVGEVDDKIKSPVSMQSEWALKVSRMYDPNRSANVMVFYGGVNDVIIGGKKAPQVIARLTDYMEQARAVGFKVVYVTMPPDHFTVITPPADYDEIRATINDDMKSHPERYDAIVDTTLDGVIGCDSCPLDHPSYFNDGLHLSTAGNAYMAGLVEPVVASFLSGHRN